MKPKPIVLSAILLSIVWLLIANQLVFGGSPRPAEPVRIQNE